MAISIKRRNEIGWLVLVDKFKEEGLGNLKPNEFRRRMGVLANKIGIPLQEATEFSEMLIRPLIDDLFSEPKNDDK